MKNAIGGRLVVKDNTALSDASGERTKEQMYEGPTFVLVQNVQSTLSMLPGNTA